MLKFSALSKIDPSVLKKAIARPDASMPCGNEGVFPTEVPPVAKRKRTENAIKLPKWVTGNTPAVQGSVVGAWPWLQQGWDFVATPEPAEEEAAAVIQELRKHVLASAFTSFDQSGGQMAVSMLNLKGSK